MPVIRTPVIRTPVIRTLTRFTESFVFYSIEFFPDMRVERALRLLSLRELLFILTCTRAFGPR